ncbi:MAG: FGGY family carbohydrate kinase [Kiritimatiellales bacterium]
MILCIDLGSTSFKAALFDSALNRRAGGSAYLNYLCTGARTELDPVEIISAAYSAVKETLRAGKNFPTEISAVAITSQAQTFALRQNNRFLTPFISWQDQRGAAISAAVKTDPHFADYKFHSSFYEPCGAQMVCLLKAVLNEHPAFGSANVLPLPSFIIEQLTGTPVLDENLAGMSGLWSLKEKTWNAGVLDYLNITADQVPSIGPLPAPAGKTESDNVLGLPAGIPVFCAGNDQTAGAYAAGLERNGGTLITLGSAQVVYQWTAELSAPAAKMIRGIYPHGGYYRMIADPFGGNLILQAVQRLQLSGFAGFFELAEKGFSGGGFLPEFDSDGKTIFEYAGKLPAEQFCAGIIEFLTNRMTGYVERMKPAGTLYIAGGGAKNQIWKNRLEQNLNRYLTVQTADPGAGAARMIAVK